MKVGNAGAANAQNTLGSGGATGVSGKSAVSRDSDVANRVAMSNANPSAKPSRVVQGKGNTSLDKDAFFKLMMTQVQSQDPTNPLKSHEMSAQLAQFSSLEQMSNIHGVLDEMKKNQGHDSQYQALDLIGKTISGDNGKIERMSGDASHEVAFGLNESASEIKVAISDAKGKVVKTFDLTNQAKGNVSFPWDGKDLDGNVLPPGNYKVSAEAKDLQGGKLSVDTKFKGAVTGVQFTERGPVMMIGNKTVAFKDVKQIEVDNSASKAGFAGLQGGQPGIAVGPQVASSQPMSPMSVVPKQGASAADRPSMDQISQAVAQLQNQNPLMSMNSEAAMPPMGMALNLNNKL
jgi:flagellar basal-body rod modification protein FlgD